MSKTPIALVPKARSTGLQPPRRLGVHGQALWDKVQSEFAIADCGGMELLAQACQSLDRAEALATIINRDGETIATRAGLKDHPSLKHELGNRAFVVRTLQKLGLNFEPVKAMGRPGKQVHWSGDDDADE
jgi:hypothetical protein